MASMITFLLDFAISFLGGLKGGLDRVQVKKRSRYNFDIVPQGNEYQLRTKR